MLEFFQAIVATNTPKMGFKDLLQLLTTPVYTPSEATQPPTSQFAVHRQVRKRVLYSLVFISVLFFQAVLLSKIGA